MSRNELELSNLDPPTLNDESLRLEVTRESLEQSSPGNLPPLLYDDNDDPSTATPSLHHQQTEDVIQSAESLIQGPAAAAAKGRKPSFLRKFNDLERPKQVCSDGIWSALYRLALFHLPPVAITLTLLYLYIAHVRWGNISAEQLSFLQFAAKGHEILILVSLTNILMHRICYSLLVDSIGLPLGFHSSPFNLGSPIQYLCSWELWATLLRPRRGERRPQITGLIIVTAIILSIAAAPLTAIAIIPRSGWWQVHIRPLMTDSREYVLYVKGDLYATELDAKHAGRYETRASEDPFLDSLKALEPTIKNPPEPVELSSTRQIANISYTNYYSDSPNRPISLTMYLPRLYLQQLTVTTCPMAGVADALGRDLDEKPTDLLTRSEQKLMDGKFLGGWGPHDRSPKMAWKMLLDAPTSRWKQPIVAVECSINETAGTSSTFSFRSNLSDSNIFVSTKENDGFRRFLENARKKKGKMPKTQYHFLDLPNTTHSPVSAHILFVTSVAPYLDENGTVYPGFEENIELTLCRIYARWVDADVWAEEGKPGAQTQLDFPLFNIQDHFGSLSQDRKPIRMKKAWLAAVGQLSKKDGTASGGQADSSYQQIIDFCLEADAITDICLDVTLAAHMTDILSQTGPVFSGWRSNEPPSLGDIVIQQTYFLGGHGYDFKSSRTIPFTFSILLLHVLIVFIHVATVLSSPRHPWHSSSWTSFGQILVLALRSKPPEELGSVGGGVESSRTWNTSVSVRVVGDEGRLEMILHDRDSSVQIRDPENERGDEGSSTGFERVKPGMRYH